MFRMAGAMSEFESVSGRKATNLNPTRDDETAKVIRRRLFASIDDSRASEVIDAYRELWTTHSDILSEEARRSTTVAEFAQTYPFHPDVLDTLTGKTATLGGFPRKYGMPLWRDMFWPLQLLAHGTAVESFRELLSADHAKSTLSDAKVSLGWLSKYLHA